MQKRSRFALIIASLLLIGTYFLPLWSISLQAPQYPDGLRMDIFINDIGGEDPNILQNMNILNHYIGMKKIEPDSIPELFILPWVVAGFIFLGLLFGIVNKKWMLVTWTILFTLFGILAIYDFYLWEYDYGHDLNPNAPIKVPGMAYQPPLLGTKMILNFKATSLPAGGGILMGVSVGLCYLVLFWNRFRKGKNV